MTEKKWTTVIEPQNKLLDLKLKEVWKYRDLIYLFVRRDIKTRYKQTVLGPLWFIIQPLFTTIIQTIVFGGFAGLPTDGIPQFLFYMAGNIPWLYFSACLTSTSNTFVGNANVFGKVYFPRFTTPISIVITTMLTFLIQFVLFVAFFIYFVIKGSEVHFTWAGLLTPVLLIQLALLSMGCGMIVSALTTKYRDLQVLVSFGVQLWMYASPVVYAASTLSPKAYSVVMLNPISPIIELSRYGWLGAGAYSLEYWAISWVTTIVVLFLGLILFNKVEKTFMDTV